MTSGSLLFPTLGQMVQTVHDLTRQGWCFHWHASDCHQRLTATHPYLPAPASGQRPQVVCEGGDVARWLDRLQNHLIDALALDHAKVVERI